MTLEMQNICKSFGTNEVLKNVTLKLKSGEICALLGENGAGKSTLMNILGGVLLANSGKILIENNEVNFNKPSDSLDSGIAFIHQELSLINDLAIFENMFIGRELKKRSGFLDIEKMIMLTQNQFDKMGLDLNPKTMVRDLDASHKQIVEIARALLMEASIIIMDEPTTSLTENEISHVFAMMETLKTQDVGIIFISHKLNEVKKICTDYVVLRDGEMVATGMVKDITTDDLARFMVGHNIIRKNMKEKIAYGESVLKVDKLSGDGFEDISFEVKKGEILGITGLLGDGRSDLCLSVFGYKNYNSGQIFIDSKPVKISNTIQAMNYGIGYLPRNRKENGIIRDMNIMDNGSIVTWPRLVKRFFIDKEKQNSEFDYQKNNLHIKMGKKTDLITSLSGGNQQKVVLAKWLSANPKVLILDNPTQGVDVGAKEEIYDIILKLSKMGVAVIVLSSEAQEIIRVCHKSIVMYHGKIQGIVEDESMNEEKIMLLATGQPDNIREEPK